MITVTTLKWVPPFAQGLVRDFRVRWVLEEVGLPYEVRLIDAPTQASAAYRAEQPFGQVPVVDLDGVTLFESGAIVLAIAERAEMLMGQGVAERARVVSWFFAALNSLEPALNNLAEVDLFMRDEAQKALRRPRVAQSVEKRLAMVEDALGGRTFLAETFSIADLLLSSVLRIIRHTDILAAFPRLTAFKARCEARPAFARAMAAQLAVFERHCAADMKW